eukprot:1273131-Alexandrium_andersonii.AAC.1
MLFLQRSQFPAKIPPKWRTQAGAPVGGGASNAVGYSMLCPSGCGAAVTARAKPVSSRGSWPKVWCHSCARSARCA